MAGFAFVLINNKQISSPLGKPPGLRTDAPEVLACRILSGARFAVDITRALNTVSLNAEMPVSAMPLLLCRVDITEAAKGIFDAFVS